eukprot:CAMPEP_0176165444 /NCGR_PEP_ID=MMETSP0120_2-20121206/84621_1 /TAXON_ID=160619 /ORGANISM="Kryptoperidinium foliaceum, Strain CCMP 1326" /LENGTH=152 /DNA_ID=CAMNT_0017502975 /DNA_START=112 /DNA_END=569 /DNA_ORIENTATION=+
MDAAEREHANDGPALAVRCEIDIQDVGIGPAVLRRAVGGLEDELEVPRLLDVVLPEVVRRVGVAATHICIRAVDAGLQLLANKATSIVQQALPQEPMSGRSQSIMFLGFLPQTLGAGAVATPTASKQQRQMNRAASSPTSALTSGAAAAAAA